MSAPQDSEGLPRLQDGFSRSLERAVAILQTLAARRRPLGVAAIADALGMARTTTHRHLRTLTMLGYLQQDSQRRYAPSLRVTELGMAAWNSMGIAEHAQPFVAELARESRLAVELTVLDGPEVLVIATADARRRAGRPDETPLLRRRPAHCTAAGKLLLAQLPATAQRALLGQGALARHAPRTITGRGALREQLARVRTEGIAVAEDELAAGTSSIAVAVHEPEVSASAALTLIAGGYRADGEALREQYGAALTATARALSARLGWREQAPRARTGGRRGQ